MKHVLGGLAQSISLKQMSDRVFTLANNQNYEHQNPSHFFIRKKCLPVGDSNLHPSALEVGMQPAVLPLLPSLNLYDNHSNNKMF